MTPFVGGEPQAGVSFLPVRCMPEASVSPVITAYWSLSGALRCGLAAPNTVMLSWRRLVASESSPCTGPAREEQMVVFVRTLGPVTVPGREGLRLGFPSGSWFCPATGCCRALVCIPASLCPFLSWPQRGHGLCEHLGPHTRRDRGRGRTEDWRGSASEGGEGPSSDRSLLWRRKKVLPGATQ